MAHPLPWLAEAQRQFDGTGRLSHATAAQLAEPPPHRLGAAQRIQRELLLGSAGTLAHLSRSLVHLAGISQAAAATPVQQIQLRREAARHLLSCGLANDALQRLSETAPMAADHPEQALCGEALAALSRVDLGLAAPPRADAAALLDRATRLAARLTRRDRMWLFADLIQVALALCWRATGAEAGHGGRLAQADAGRPEDNMSLLGRLIAQPDAERADALPELHVMVLLGRQTLQPESEALRSRRLGTIVALQAERDTPAEVWTWMGLCCQRAGQAGPAAACHRQALAVAGDTGARRAARLSRAELAPMFAAAGDYRSAYDTLAALREDELLLWAASDLPLGRRWHHPVIAAESQDGASGCSATAALHTQRACEFIEQHLSSTTGTVEVAQACGVSRRTLEQAFRTVLGCSVKEHVRRLRVARVRSRLETSNDVVKRIAHDLGYPNVSSMGREFKLQTGQTITAFRLTLGKR